MDVCFRVLTTFASQLSAILSTKFRQFLSDSNPSYFILNLTPFSVIFTSNSISKVYACRRSSFQLSFRVCLVFDEDALVFAMRELEEHMSCRFVLCSQLSRIFHAIQHSESFRNHCSLTCICESAERVYASDKSSFLLSFRVCLVLDVDVLVSAMRVLDEHMSCRYVLCFQLSRIYHALQHSETSRNHYNLTCICKYAGRLLSIHMSKYFNLINQSIGMFAKFFYDQLLVV